jgi:hypothetical protein
MHTKHIRFMHKKVEKQKIVQQIIYINKFCPTSPSLGFYFILFYVNLGHDITLLCFDVDNCKLKNRSGRFHINKPP